MRTSFLLMLAGPLVWAAHFFFVYAVNGIICSRPALHVEWLGAAASTWLISGAGLLAVTTIATFHSFQRKNPAVGALHFMSRLGATLSLLSALAIIWETLPLLLLPACG